MFTKGWANEGGGSRSASLRPRRTPSFLGLLCSVGTSGRVRQVAEDPDVVVLREGEEDFREPRHSIVGCSCNNDPTSLSRYQSCDEGSDEGLPGAGSRLDGCDVVLSQSKGDRSASWCPPGSCSSPLLP